MLIKFDVEGFEPHLLAGLDFSCPFRPKNILIGCGRTLGAAAWGSCKNFAAFFIQRGYDLFDVLGPPLTDAGPLLEESWTRDRDQAP